MPDHRRLSLVEIKLLRSDFRITEAQRACFSNLLRAFAGSVIAFIWLAVFVFRTWTNPSHGAEMSHGLGFDDCCTKEKMLRASSFAFHIACCIGFV